MENKKFGRGLEEVYIKQLKTGGCLSFLRNKNFIGKDVDIQIRKNYINLYYRGASLIKFLWKDENNYIVEISETYFKPKELIGIAKNKVKYNADGNIKNDKRRICKFTSESIVDFKNNFKENIEQLKKNIRYLGKGKENAFEQLFIENNFNQNNKPEFLILDRQITFEDTSRKRLDLVALSKINNSDEYRINLIELKYGEDPRIPNVHNEQLQEYYSLFYDKYENIKDMYEEIIRQKIKIGRWPYEHKISISNNKNTMRKIAVFGNINKCNLLLEKAKKQFDKNTFFIVQNNILKEEDLKGA